MTKADEIELAIRRARHPDDCPDCGTPQAKDGNLMALAVGLCAKHWKNPHPSYALECAQRRAEIIAQIGGQATEIPVDNGGHDDMNSSMEIAMLRKMVAAVHCPEFASVWCDDIEGRNWFDVQKEVLNGPR